MRSKRAITIGLALLSIQQLGLSQGRLFITSKRVPPSRSVAQTPFPAFWGRVSELRPLSGADLGVKQALDEIERMLSRATRLRLGPNLGVTTFVQEGYDSLLTKYERSDVQSNKTIFVSDTGSNIVVLIPYQPSAFATAESARRFIDEIVRWENFRSDLEVRLVFDLTTRALGGEGIPGASSIRWRFWFRTSLIGRQNYLVWSFSKMYFDDVFSEELLGLAERFPPLSERCRNRSKEEVRSMLSQVTGRYSPLSRHDDIILRELLRRGISAQEFSALLVPAGAEDYRIRLRAQAMARAVAGSGKALEFEALVHATLSSLDPSSSQSEAAVNGLLSELKRNEKVDVAPTVCLLLQQNKFTEPALHYLARHAGSQVHEECAKYFNLHIPFDSVKEMTLWDMLLPRSRRP